VTGEELKALAHVRNLAKHCAPRVKPRDIHRLGKGARAVKNPDEGNLMAANAHLI
jgi:hypothetical protein